MWLVCLLSPHVGTLRPVGSMLDYERCLGWSSGAKSQNAQKKRNKFSGMEQSWVYLELALKEHYCIAVGDLNKLKQHTLVRILKNLVG